MQLRQEQLGRHLEQQLLPIYLVTGDEPLLLQESCDLIRQHARTSGVTDREVLEASGSGFSWHELINSAASMSLFAERKLIELRLPSGKPGAEGSKALCEYVEMSSSEDVLLIVAGKIDKQSTKSKWFKTLDQAGGIVQVWPVDSKNLPRWLEQRVSQAGMTITRDGLQLLCERVQGNLLSAVQEVEKLKLLAVDGQLTADTITSSVSDSARYNLFSMADTAVQGDATASLRMLYGLRGEGTEATVVLWALARELRTLHDVQAACASGQDIQQAMRAHGVWNNKMPAVKSALSRHSLATLTYLLEQAVGTDGSIKGFADGRPWDRLAGLVVGLSQPGRMLELR